MQTYRSLRRASLVSSVTILAITSPSSLDSTSKSENILASIWTTQFFISGIQSSWLATVKASTPIRKESVSYFFETVLWFSTTWPNLTYISILCFYGTHRTHIYSSLVRSSAMLKSVRPLRSLKDLRAPSARLSLNADDKFRNTST